MVVMVHGGPEAQYRPSFNPLTQYLVASGFAVVAPNVRGSTGYGRAYQHLDDVEKRLDSVRDLAALHDWLQTQPDLDADRAALYGGSYGGYMVLAGLVFQPERWAAGVDIVGISNFATFLQNTTDYRRDLRRAEYGDERDPEMRAFMERIAPVNNAQRIGKPLFVVQGKNDPRVPASEALQIVEKARGNNAPVWFLMANDEGHGFAKKENADFLFYAMVMFMREFLLK